MLNKVLTGGPCGPSDQAGQISSQNPLAQAVDSMFTGQAQAQQRAEGHVMMQTAQQQENMMAMNQQFNNLMNEQMMEQQFQQQQMQQQQIQQNNIFAARLMEQQNQQVNLNSLWDAAEANAQNASAQIADARQEGPQMAGPALAGPQPFLQPWMNPAMMQRPMFQAPMQQQPLVMKEEAKQSESDQKTQNQTDTSIAQASGNMVSVLSTSSDPKHRNSEFLKFLQQLNHGALEINEESQTLVENQEKMAEFDKLEEQRLKDESIRQKEEEQFKQEQKEMMKDLLEKDDVDQIEEKEEDEDEQDFNHEVMTEDQFAKLMEMWKQEASQFGGGQQMMDEWNKVWEEEAEMGMMGTPSTIQFQAENKFKEQEFKDTNLLEKAKQLIEAGKIQEAILCLEAEVQQNKENAEAWRLLGVLFQENDQDDFAIIALRNAHEADPYDLDSLMSLGISSTNELEGQEAMKYLTHWLKYHPDFCSLPILEKGEVLQLDDLEQAFIEANNLKSQDTQVMNALGVIQFIRRDFDKATKYFEMAIKENPIDHSVWNKYGAALANSLKTEEAMAAYKQAIDLRPNYVRTLVNIGLAHDNQAQFDDAISSFLNALILNPKATHIWSYVRRSMVQSGKLALLEKLQQRDPLAFKGEYNLIDPQNLPAQNMDNLHNHKIFQS